MKPPGDPSDRQGLTASLQSDVEGKAGNFAVEVQRTLNVEAHAFCRSRRRLPDKAVHLQARSERASARWEQLDAHEDLAALKRRGEARRGSVSLETQQLGGRPGSTGNHGTSGPLWTTVPPPLTALPGIR